MLDFARPSMKNLWDGALATRRCRAGTISGVCDYPVWLFDFDGTLIDTEEVILDCYRHAALEVLGAELPEDVVRANLSRTLREASDAVAADDADR